MDSSPDKLRELVDRAAKENDRVKFAELIRQINCVVATDRRILPETPMFETHVPSETAGDIFDIFAGCNDRDALWIEAVTGLENARQRLREIRNLVPGDYFIFHANSRAILKVEAESSSESTPSSSRPKKSVAA